MALLEVNNLRTSFFTDAGEVKAVDGVSFTLDHGKVLGIVGESGSRQIGHRPIPSCRFSAPNGRIVGGQILQAGRSGAGRRGRKASMRRVRGKRISIIFQDPMTSPEPGLHRRQPARWRRSCCTPNATAREAKERAPSKCCGWSASTSLKSGSGSIPTSCPAACASAS